MHRQISCCTLWVNRRKGSQTHLTLISTSILRYSILPHYKLHLYDYSYYYYAKFLQVNILSTFVQSHKAEQGAESDHPNLKAASTEHCAHVKTTRRGSSGSQVHCARSKSLQGTTTCSPEPDAAPACLSVSRLSSQAYVLWFSQLWF